MEELLERMDRAVTLLEAATQQMQGNGLQIAAETEERIGRLVATAEAQRECELSDRLAQAELKLAEAEAKIAEMSAAAAGVSQRKTAAAGSVATLAKQGIQASGIEGMELGRMEAGALDAALSSLSIEQRFAVKAELLRAGLL